MVFVSWLLARLKEPTTYLGLTAILSSMGIVLDPELTQNIQTAGLGVAGIILFIMREKKD
jgi:hypothetical protein